MIERGDSATFDADALIERVTRQTFVRTMEVHAELSSTNDRGMSLAKSPGIERPYLILARRQSAGRGRGGNRWWSSDGALTFSLLLSIDVGRLPHARWPELSLTFGSSICQALRPFAGSADLRLKWPNDVYANGRKICGILVEVPSLSDGAVVLGVGLNVNNDLADAPEEVQSKGIALCALTGGFCPSDDVLIAVLRSFERHVDLLCDNPDEMRRVWRSDDLLMGRRVVVREQHTTVAGSCEGIDDDGALLVRTAAGPQRVYGGVVETFE